MIAKARGTEHAGGTSRPPCLHLTSLLAVLAVLCSAHAMAQQAQEGEGWRRHVIDDTALGARAIYPLDVNGNGLMDLAVPWEESGEVRLYFNPGAFAAREPWPYVVVGEVDAPMDASIIDLDRDGSFDVISATGGDNKTLYIHWGPPEVERYAAPEAWTTQAIPDSQGRRAWTFVRPAQLTAREGMDLVAGAQGTDAALGWFEAPPDARRLQDWTWRPLRPARAITALIIHDMNKNRRPDIIFAEREGQLRGVWWLEHPGLDRIRQPWPPNRVGAYTKAVTALAAGDLDGDGATDFVAVTEAGEVLRFGPAPEAEQRVGEQRWLQRPIQIPRRTGAGAGIAMGDITGDARQDIIVTTTGATGSAGVYRLSYHSGQTWRAFPISGPEGSDFGPLQLLDLSGNGALDVLSSEAELGLIWYESPFRAPFLRDGDEEEALEPERLETEPLQRRQFTPR